ncbi:hypothetical protein J4466_01325 [Candidatus Pacearchaeota archaeon]|nr:hypothetical protein [Candidatus Pacearchaeota archaeon]
MPHNILFLQQFTKELIINSTPKEFLRKLELQDINKKEQVKEELKSEMLQEKIEIKPDIPSIVHQLPTIPIPRRQNVKSMQIPSPLLKTNNQFSNYQGLELGKITPIIVNQGVISIECPGPGKLISVRSIGRATPTKMMLNKEEINSIIESFSQQAKIPRIGGIFKAIVNNLVITAIDSDVAGPRFIITKVHPQPSQFL